MKLVEFKLKIGDLLRDKEGTMNNFDFDEKVSFSFDGNEKPLSNVSGRLTLVKIREGLNVLVEDLELKVEFKCTKCQKPFHKDIKTENAERIFFFEKQEETADAFDYFYIDVKKLEIDVSDFLRQEIILHFPMIPVHSNSCKGLCPKCGTDLNKKTCSCDTSSDHQKPLAKLKDLYNA